MPMRREHIPTETARALLAIHEVGSLAKAASILGLTQPAISLQLRRIEAMVGGPIFVKTPTGSRTSELGESVLPLCRRMIEANDRILAIGGIEQTSRFLRVGISPLLIRDFLNDLRRAEPASVIVHSDSSENLARRLLNQQLDIVCLLDVDGSTSAEIRPFVRHEFQDDLVWVCSRNFVLGPGTPIPIITWSGENDPITHILTAKGISFRVTFNGGDTDTKRMAVEAGLGLTCLPKRQMSRYLLVADDYHLPKLPQMKGLLCVGADVDEMRASTVLERLLRLFF